MKNFSEFIENFEQKEKSSKKINEQDLKNKYEQKIKEDYMKYSTYSEDELTNLLFKEVQRQKQQGTFDFERLKNAVEMLMPYITPEQKQKINNILSNIK